MMVPGGLNEDAVAELRAARLEAEVAARNLVAVCRSPAQTASSLASAAEQMRWASGRLWSAAEAVRFLTPY